MNLRAARSLGETIRPTLGPCGREKLLVDSEGSVVVTDDGATILEEMKIAHPAATLVVEVAEAQEAAVGDGTTSAVVLAGELLAESEALIEAGVHPAAIVAGYREAASHAREAIGELAITIGPGDEGLLAAVAATAMAGTGSDGARAELARAVVEAVLNAVGRRGRVDRELIAARPFRGASIGDSRFLSGALVDKKPPHPNMETAVGNAAVLVYEGDLELEGTEADVGATVEDAESAAAFADRDRAELEGRVERILASGADVVLVEGGIDDRVQHRFVEAGVLALRRTSEDDRRRVAVATDANRVGRLEALSRRDLGYAGSVRRELIRGLTHTGSARPEQTTVFDDLPRPAGTILLRGGTEQVVEGVERAVDDAIGATSAAVEDRAVLPGGGAPEMAMARAVREAAGGIEGRERLAAEAFADALEVVPRVLAENAGHDAIDAVTALTARHDAGDRTAGIDAAGEPADAIGCGIVEPRRVTDSALASAVEAATMILRIDDVVAADGLSTAGDGD